MYMAVIQLDDSLNDQILSKISLFKWYFIVVKKRYF